MNIFRIFFTMAFFLISWISEVHGQTILLQEDFDSVTPPTLPEGWVAENASGTGTTWVTYGVFANSPPNCAAVFGDWQPKDEWLFSPEVTMEAGVSYRLGFHYRTSFSPQKIKVMMGNSQESETMVTQIYINENVTNTTYQEGFAIITPDEETSVHFGWHVFDSQNNGSIYLDDILFEEMAAIPEIVVSPGSYNFGTISINETAETTIQVTNLGGAPLVIDQVELNPPFFASYSGTILPGESDTVDILFDPDEAGVFNEEMIFIVEESTAGTNSIMLAGVAYDLVTGFFEDFEASTELPPGWSSIVESTGGSAGVTIYQAGQFYNHAFSGEHAARLFNATTEDIIMLITPELADLQGGTLSFWTKVAVFPEPLIIGTMADSESHTTFEAIETITAEAEYAQHTFTFESAPDDHVYIAFKHGTSSNMRPLFIDDVSWTEEPDLAPPQNLTVTGVPGGGLTLLEWEAPDEGEPLGYNVYRNGDLYSITLLTGTEFEDDSFEHGVEYTYYVTAVYPDGESEPSNTVVHVGDMGYRLIYASAGENGTIEPEGTVVLGYGDDQLFEVTAHTGYHISSLIVDDQETETALGLAYFEYLFENVTEYHEIHAEFAINMYQLIYHAGEGGSISGTTHQEVPHGESGTPVEAVADTDYVFYTWSDGNTDNPRTDTNITGDLEVTANFESTVNIPEPEMEVLIIYPNPTDGLIWLQTDENFVTTEETFFRLFDSGGKLLLESSLDSKLQSVSLEGFNRGIYLLEVRTKDSILKVIRVEKR